MNLPLILHHLAAIPFVSMESVATEDLMDSFAIAQIQVIMVNFVKPLLVPQRVMIMPAGQNLILELTSPEFVTLDSPELLQDFAVPMETGLL